MERSQSLCLNVYGQGMEGKERDRLGGLSDCASYQQRAMIDKEEGITPSVSISRIPPKLTLTAALFVCRCRFGWSIPSTFLLLFFSFCSQLTFCVSSDPTPTTAAITFGFGPSTPPNPNPPTSPLKSIEAQVRDHEHDHVGPKILTPLIVSAVLLFLALLIFMMAFFTKLFRIKKLRRRPTNQVGVLVDQQIEDVDNGFSCSVKKYCWEDIETFTKNFSQVIGSGGFSNVYLACLPNSTQAAIKIHSGSDRLNQVFKQELDILLHLCHDNIVKLLGFCNDRDEGALVFEYSPNGTLQEKLHGASEERGYVLPWRSRMAIAFQLAQAIEYLHEKCSLLIVHGDIKASNILLDEYLNCKLCDFGSAKMGFSSTVLPQSSSSPSRTKQVMIGSPGYTDPHYLRSGIASKKNDVYSFGVIILELVTGLEAFCPERGQLTSIAGPMLKDIAAECEAIKVAEMVDPRLAGNFDLEEARAMLSISSLCLRQSPILRPSATQILSTIKDKIPSISFLCSSQKESQVHSK